MPAPTRHAPLALLGVILLLLLAGLCVPLAAAGAPGAGHRPGPTGAVGSPPAGTWPTFRGSPGRSGFSASDGPAAIEVGWDRVLSTQPGLHLRTSAVINGSRVIVSDDLGDVYALNGSANGSTLWRSNVGPTPTAPTLAGGLVLFGDGYGGVTALSEATGARVWNLSLSSPIIGGLLTVGGVVYGATYAGGVFALTVGSGQMLWQRSVGAALSGAPASDGTNLYLASGGGALFALDLASGAVRWSVSVGATVRTGPVTDGGRVLLTEFPGRLAAFGTNGTALWTFSIAGLSRAGPIEAPPAVDASTAYLVDDSGGEYAVWLANGSLRWNGTTPFPYTLGYNVTSAPLVTPHGLYLVDALQNLDDVDPRTGALLWGLGLDTSVYASPALAGGELVLGDDLDALISLSSPTLIPSWPVQITVVDPNGSAVPNATLLLDGGPTVQGNGSGRLALSLPNGSYAATLAALGFYTLRTELLVAGPTNLTVGMRPIPLYPVVGRVFDAGSFIALAGVTIRLHSLNYSTQSHTVTGADGSFRLRGDAGWNVLEVLAPSGYSDAAFRVYVLPNETAVAELPLAPEALGAVPQGPTGGAWLAVWPVAALVGASVALGYYGAAFRRRYAGLPGPVLSRFGRFVLMRGLLVPVQATLLLALLFVFGRLLPTAAQGLPPCAASGGFCTGGSWQDPASVVAAFFGGWGTFVWNMLTLNWGLAGFGNLIQPVSNYIEWWLPPSVELGVIALGLSALLAYPIGLRAGWRPDGYFDSGARLGALLVLLVPTFLVVILFFGELYGPFSRALGDTPYGLTPTISWWEEHGGEPSWIGIAANTLPTGFPLVDGLLHRDWAFELVTLAKTLLQALLIALIYVSIFLRYARHAVVERARSLPIIAARARGVPESTLLWRHAGREVIPVYVLIFGITLPMYLGTQSVVESLFNDTGLGRVLISEMLVVARTGFGFSSTAHNPAGNLYQVAIFLLLMAVLGASLFSDILTHYLDPRLAREGR